MLGERLGFWDYISTLLVITRTHSDEVQVAKTVSDGVQLVKTFSIDFL